MLIQNHNNSKRQFRIFDHPLMWCVCKVKPNFYVSAFLFFTLNVRRFCFSLAIGVFLFTLPLSAQPSLLTATSTLDSVAVHQQKEHFESVTIQYLNSLTDGLHSQSDLNLLKDEISFFNLLLTPEKADHLDSLWKESPNDAGQFIARHWNSMDPTPITNVNERLIEHRVRIHEARVNFSDPESSLGFDDRALIFIKYGEPDRILDRRINTMNFNKTEIFIFTSQIYEEPRAASFVADELLYQINMHPFSTHLNIWLYNRLNTEHGNSLAFYFSEQKNNIFKRITSIDYGFPNGLYRTPRELKFAPALVLQYLTYRQLMPEDQIFMETFQRMNSEILYANFEDRQPFVWRLMANSLKTKNNQIETRRQLQAPPENSSEEDLIQDIEINIHQYRSFNTHFQPLLITFFESHPTVAFLQDLTKNNDPMMADIEDNEQILSLISQWYSLQQGIELYDAEQNQVGRIRDWPFLQLESDNRQPTITIADLPYIGEGASQIFYSKLLNNHPETAPAQPSLYPDELRGLGRAVVYQTEHLQTGEKMELLMSDLIFGYNRIDHDDIRFPFIVKHDHIIPENENPVIHFELFGLEQDLSGFAHFEIAYQFEPKLGLLSFIRQTSDRFSGTLDFTSSATHFRESIEFGNLPLRKGNYSLTWVVKDLISGRELSRELKFKVEESDQFTITAN